MRVSRWRFIENFAHKSLKMPQKASKSGLLVQKSGGLFKFCCTGGLIKSGGLYALIRYAEWKCQTFGL